MSVLRSGAFALLFILATLPAQAADAAKPAGMQRLEQFLERAQSLQARFHQQIVQDDASGQPQIVDSTEGEVLLKRPGRFRWDYSKPYVRSVVADGREIWLYEADLEQATVRPFAEGLGDTPAALLSGRREALDRFEFVNAWSGERLEWVKLKPRAAEADFQSVAIAFAGDKPAQFELTDRLGQQTRIRFSDVKINAPVDEARFRFRVPPGVDVIREGP